MVEPFRSDGRVVRASDPTVTPVRVEVSPTPPEVDELGSVADEHDVFFCGVSALALPAGPDPGPARTWPAIGRGLEWLADHQSPDGSWSRHGHRAGNLRQGRLGVCVLGEDARPDIRATSLALLAFLGDGHTTREGTHKSTVARAVAWLRDQRCLDGEQEGRIGEQEHPHALEDHAIAAWALCDTFAFSTRNPLLKRTAKQAVGFLGRDSQRTGREGSGQIPTVAWTLLAARAASETALTEHPVHLEQEALERIERLRSRPTRSQDPRIRLSTASTSALARLFLGHTVADDSLLLEDAELLSSRLPTSAVLDRDLEAWVWATRAMHEIGGELDERWRAALEGALVPAQHQGGCEGGSWIGRPGTGRDGDVGRTALALICLETRYRYGRILR